MDGKLYRWRHARLRDDDDDSDRAQVVDHAAGIDAGADEVSLADRAAVMQSGRIVQIGSPRELYGRPRSRFVAEMLGETNLLPARVRGRQGDRIEFEIAGGARLAEPRGLEPYSSMLSDGMPVTLSIRPEAIRVGDANSELNAFQTRHLSD